MKTRIWNIVLLINSLLIIAGCEESDFESCIDCLGSTFKQTYVRCLQDDEVFFIKGVALDVDKHGRNIKVVEDLKGNLAGKSSIFVWGMSSTSFCDDKGRQDMRIDNIVQYQQNDTLIMLITGEVLKNYNRVENPHDYKTIGGSPSVLKLSNGRVTGNIHYWQKDVAWKELQEELDELQAVMNPEKKPAWWSEEYLPAPFIAACKWMNQSTGTDDRYFFIQGLVSGASNSDYGRQIQIITDLRGNFPEETAAITVWGTTGSRPERFDDLRLYNHPDTVLMLLQPVGAYGELISNNTENQGDYATHPYTFSVLKLSKNTVSGCITSCFKGEETMSREEFEKLLNSIK